MKIDPGTRLYIATPCYGSMLHAHYVHSLLRTCNRLTRMGMPHTPAFIPGDSLITRARNVLAAQFMASNCTHMLFIDGDLKWEPESILRLLAATCHPDIEVACGVYPKKMIPPEFPVNFIASENGSLSQQPDSGYVEIKDAPTGFLMIRRSALEKMMAAYPDRKCTLRQEVPEVEVPFEYALFDCFIDEGRYLSEDFGFSRLWQRIGGRVWMDPEIKLSHFGGYEYKAEVSSLLVSAEQEAPGSIVIGLLTWNTAEASRLAALAIAEEVRRLSGVGLDASYYWVDNGSTDSTVEAVGAALGDTPGARTLNNRNVGQCAARNEIIERAIAGGAEYLMFVDGDIEIIPCSAFAFYGFLSSRPVTDACVGMHSGNCTDIAGDGVPERCVLIDSVTVKTRPAIAWTQYGMFRTRIFREGVRFEESGPFSGPGWGFEDDDLYFQMVERGYRSYNAPGFRYYHRSRSSSAAVMGVEVAAESARARREFLFEKWAQNEEVRRLMSGPAWKGPTSDLLKRVKTAGTGDGRPTDARQIEGWMSDAELGFLAGAAANVDSVAEVGSWKGRSTFALLSNCDGPVYAVDHWRGSDGEREGPHAEAVTGDVFAAFLRNVGHFPNLHVVKKASVEGVAEVPEVDLVFIDGGHSYEDAVADIRAWMPRARKVICGHDYGWPGVARAVAEVLGPVRRGPGSIWIKEISCG